MRTIPTILKAHPLKTTLLEYITAVEARGWQWGISGARGSCRATIFLVQGKQLVDEVSDEDKHPLKAFHLALASANACTKRKRPA